MIVHFMVTNRLQSKGIKYCFIPDYNQTICTRQVFGKITNCDSRPQPNIMQRIKSK